MSVCSNCGEDAFRFCNVCQKFYCFVCVCDHLNAAQVEMEEVLNQPNLLSEADSDGWTTVDSEPKPSHWLSNEVIAAGWTDKQLSEAVARYEGLLVTLKMEIARRKVAGGFRGSVSSRNNHNRSRDFVRVPGSKSVLSKALDLLIKSGLTPEQAANFLETLKGR